MKLFNFRYKLESLTLDIPISKVTALVLDFKLV